MLDKLPLWLRAVLLVGAAVLATGAGLFAYRYFTRPTTLTVAVGSIDGGPAKLMSAMANQFALTAGAPEMLSTAEQRLERLTRFQRIELDLAVVRGNVGDLSRRSYSSHKPSGGTAHCTTPDRRDDSARQAEGPDNRQVVRQE